MEHPAQTHGAFDNKIANPRELAADLHLSTAAKLRAIATAGPASRRSRPLGDCPAPRGRKVPLTRPEAKTRRRRRRVMRHRPRQPCKKIRSAFALGVGPRLEL